MTAVRHHTIEVQGLPVFYREAGDPTRPTLVLLHGFPSSSAMFAALMRDLGDDFHLIAPDHVGFGRSAELHLLDAGHFALETHAPEIAVLIREFLARTGS
ncbi:alpha/beta fold hydrolase [Nocardia tengchongensis]